MNEHAFYERILQSIHTHCDMEILQIRKLLLRFNYFTLLLSLNRSFSFWQRQCA